MTRSTVRAVVLACSLFLPVACGSGSGGGSGGAPPGSGGVSGTASGGTTGTGTGGTTGASSGGTTGAGSGGTSGASTSGVQGSKRLDALTTDEKKKLCDFEAQHFGGYGKSIDCPDGTSLSADDSQADCLSQWPTTCATTVTQAEACAKDSTCADPIPASCAPLFQCL